ELRLSRGAQPESPLHEGRDEEPCWLACSGVIEAPCTDHAQPMSARRLEGQEFLGGLASRVQRQRLLLCGFGNGLFAQIMPTVLLPAPNHQHRGIPNAASASSSHLIQELDCGADIDRYSS